MPRALLILYVLLCFELGVFLLVLPWVPIWSHNHFVTAGGWFSVFALNHYVRGAVSGLGLADIWLAIHELWRLRYEIGLVRERPARPL
jgi:hypothetical protein